MSESARVRECESARVCGGRGNCGGEKWGGGGGGDDEWGGVRSG